MDGSPESKKMVLLETEPTPSFTFTYKAATLAFVRGWAGGAMNRGRWQQVCRWNDAWRATQAQAMSGAPKLVRGMYS